MFLCPLPAPDTFAFYGLDILVNMLCVYLLFYNKTIIVNCVYTVQTRGLSLTSTTTAIPWYRPIPLERVDEYWGYIYRFVDIVGFPVLIRPSYILSGAVMNVVSNKEELLHFLELAAEVSKDHSVVVSEFIE